MSDLVIIFCVAVLPFLALGVLRFIKRDQPKNEEEPETIDEVGKGFGDSVLGSLLSRFWP